MPSFWEGANLAWTCRNGVGVLLAYLFALIFFDCFRLFEGLLSGSEL